MRIGIDALALPPQAAGASRYLVNLIRHLARTDGQNTYFLFLKRRDLELFAGLPGNFRRVAVPNYPRPARLFWQRVRPAHYVQKLGLDLWHAPHYVVPQNLGRCRLAVTFHDLTFFLFPHYYDAVRRRSFQTFIRQAVDSADAIICVSRTTKKDLVRLFPETEPRAVAIPSGVDERFLQAPPSTDPSVSRSETRAPYVLFVGTLERRKNVPALVAAFAEMIESSGLPHHLVLVGQAENDRGAVRRAIARSGLSDRIHLTGYVDDHTLYTLYAGAALFVCPSHYEGFSFPVLEAMALGIPVLCANAGASAEVAGHPDRLFPPADVPQLARMMHRVLTDKDHRHDLVCHGLRRVDSYRWDTAALATRELYERLVQGPLEKEQAWPSREATPAEARRFWSLPKPRPSSRLEDAIVRTLAYADLFDYPLTLEELHRGLIGERASVEEVRRAAHHGRLRQRITVHRGFYYFRGKGDLVRLRHHRRQKARALLHRHRHLLNLLCRFPFVRGVALTGALAFDNANGREDIDLFLLVEGRRVWWTYLCLALLLKIVGKRRIICINYVEGRDDLSVPERNFFVAHQIANLRPLTENGAFDRFWKANSWVNEFLPQAKAPEPNGTGLFQYRLPPSAFLQRTVERLTSGKLVDRLDNWVYGLYKRRIENLTRHLDSGVEVGRQRIQLFTNDHLPAILARFEKRLQELNVLDSEEPDR